MGKKKKKHESEGLKPYPSKKFIHIQKKTGQDEQQPRTDTQALPSRTWLEERV